MDSAGGRKPDPVVSQAIAWWVRLQSGVAGADELRSCEAWLAHRNRVYPDDCIP